MKSTFSSQRTAGFTLMELLVVIAIIAILAGLLLQTAGAVQEKAARSRAEVEIQGLSSALDSYKQDMGTYPDGDGKDNSTKVLIQELAIGPFDNPDNYNHRKPYEFSLRILSAYRPGTNATYDSVLRASDNLVDPFGNPYHYYFSSTAAANNTSTPNPETSSINNGPQFFDLWSYGKGGDTATNKAKPAKWIKNW